MVTPAARREAVAYLRVAFAVSERRACLVLGTDRTSVRYRRRRPDDVHVRKRLRELAAMRRRGRQNVAKPGEEIEIREPAASKIGDLSVMSDTSSPRSSQQRGESAARA
jgi:hypothetical protein